MMRIQLARGVRWATVPVLALLLTMMSGCGGDSGGEPDPTPVCAISDLNTSLEDSWLSGEAVNIRWTQNSVPSTVQIELLKAGQVVETIATGVANSGFYPWIASTGGQTNGSDFGIRVTGTATPSCTSEINGLTITNVDGCNIAFAADFDDTAVLAGDDFEITWTSFHTSGTVTIELWNLVLGGGLDTRVGVIAFEIPDTGSHTWTVDSFHAGSDDYRYVIRDVAVAGCEAISPKFAMTDLEICTLEVVGPFLGQIFQLGEQMQIQLDQTNGSSLVNLRLYTGDEFVPGGQIADDVSVVGAGYRWTVTDFNYAGNTDRYHIRAIDALDEYCTGTSDRFTISR